MARILLLGSTGFFGRGVAHKLIDDGHQLRVLVRDPMKAAAFRFAARRYGGRRVEPRPWPRRTGNRAHHQPGCCTPEPASVFSRSTWTATDHGRGGRRPASDRWCGQRDRGQSTPPQVLHVAWMGEQELAKSVSPARFSIRLCAGGRGRNPDAFDRAWWGLSRSPGSGQAQMQPIFARTQRCVS